MTQDKKGFVLNFTKDKKQNIRIASAYEGLSMSAYIQKAIDEKLERDGERND